MRAEKKYTNKLIHETSPYLLQHAHNPVDWYSWGEEAFDKAKKEDKPVLVSIGYSACHWCHVMEHESFEDEATAAIMNDHFVNIKVDMEERPDVDQIYMTFVQLTTGRGGWPMNVFLTPEKIPFFGGTYFPPVNRYNMPSWQQILVSVADAYRNKREEIERSSLDILGEMRRIGLTEFSTAGLSYDLLDAAFASFDRSFDATNGGFGGAPKFPPAMGLEFLMRYWKRTGNERALEIVKHTATKMACGGIYDQLGGGFHRYSVDAVWLVPHFEKMLYDNAQMIKIYLHLSQVESGVDPIDPLSAPDARPQISDFFRRIAVETLEYARREMLDPSGGFYSTQDADSEGEEGKFFVWTPEEIIDVLGESDGKEFCAFYGATASGNFEGRNILNISAESWKLIAGSWLGKNSAQLTANSHQLFPGIDDLRTKLFEVREKRIKPFRDEKVLAAWNGLMLSAVARAAFVLQNEEYLEIARRNADFLLTRMRQGKQLFRTWKDGTAKLNGYIEDYANVADGLVELYQISGESRYLDEARALAETMIVEFWDEQNGGFFFTANDHEELIVRNKDFYDNATPSGNSVAADVLLKLAKLTGEERYERFAMTTLRLIAAQIKRHPQGFGRALSTIEFSLASVKEIAILGPRGNELEQTVASQYLPNGVFVFSNGPDDSSPLLKDRDQIDGMPTAYVCENFVCQRPVTNFKELNELIKA